MMGNLSRRKHIRLTKYDYSSAGAYFVTICTYNRRCLLANIVGRGLAPAVVELTEYGEIAKEQLLLLEERFCHLKIGQYVIMPNHIHAIFILSDKAAGASPRPTIMDMVCAYKSLASRKCKEKKHIDKVFQSSFF